MKNFKLLVLAFVCTMTCMSVSANNSVNDDDPLSPAALAFQKQVKAFLETEGYKPYIDEDNDLCFKHDGNSYWITLGDGDGKPVYIEFHRAGFNIEDANRVEILEAANHVNLNNKCVKASVGSKSLAFTIEMVSNNAKEFCKTIDRYLELLDYGAEQAEEYYSEH